VVHAAQGGAPDQEPEVPLVSTICKSRTERVDHGSTLYRGAIAALALRDGPLGGAGAGASLAVINGEGNPVDASVAGAGPLRAEVDTAGRAGSCIGRCVAVTGAIERLVLGDAADRDGDRVTIRISGMTVKFSVAGVLTGPAAGGSNEIYEAFGFGATTSRWTSLTVAEAASIRVLICADRSAPSGA